MSASNDNDNPWTVQAYQASSSFVPLLTTKVVEWLDPQPFDEILDIGCGDGVLTAKIKSRCAYVCGLDGSANMIDAAETNYGDIKGLDWQVKDCRHLERIDQSKKYSKIFSNAALHWILRDPITRHSVLESCFNLLEPKGTFVFEMGGAGNVAEAHGALISALVHHGIPIKEAREACPWFFPSENLIRQMVELAGFKVERSELQYRPTKLTEGEGGGLDGWIRLHGDGFLGLTKSTGDRESVVKEVCQSLQSVMTHEEDGSMWIGYVRLRILARKPWISVR